MAQSAGRLYWNSGSLGQTIELITTEDATIDSQHFDRRIARLTMCYSSEASQIDEAQRLVDRVQDELRKGGYECVYVRVHLGDTRMIHALERAKFNLMDILQTLRLDLKGPELKISSSSIRSFVPSDAPRIMQIARDTFTPSRFFADTHFSTEAAREYYAKWTVQLLQRSSKRRACDWCRDGHLRLHYRSDNRSTNEHFSSSCRCDRSR